MITWDEAEVRLKEFAARTMCGRYISLVERIGRYFIVRHRSHSEYRGSISGSVCCNAWWGVWSGRFFGDLFYPSIEAHMDFRASGPGAKKKAYDWARMPVATIVRRGSTSQGRSTMIVVCACGHVNEFYQWSWAGNGFARCKGCGRKINYKTLKVTE